MERRRQPQQGHRADHRARTRAGASAYKIYYIPGFLAGPVEQWSAHFARVAKLGFDHVCLAPVGAPGRSGNIFLADDIDQADQRLGSPATTQGILADVAKQARAHGLATLVDVVLDKVAVDGAMARAHPDLFQPPTAGRDVLDPRLDQPQADAARARFDDPAAARSLARQWSGRLALWSEAGVAGFRLLGLDRSKGFSGSDRSLVKRQLLAHHGLTAGKSGREIKVAAQSRTDRDADVALPKFRTLARVTPRLYRKHGAPEKHTKLKFDEDQTDSEPDNDFENRDSDSGADSSSSDSE